MESVKDRATAIFVQGGERTVADCKAMHAEHSAKGLLKSGATLKRAVRIYCENSGAALKQILGEVADQVEHRGRAWKAAMVEVEDALEAHAANAPALLEASFKMATVPGDAAHKAAMGLVDRCVADLHSQLAGFKDGWTAPRPKSWKERHPMAWDMGLATFSAIAGAVAALLITANT